MKLPAVIHAFKWLIRDTFRQAMHSGMFWLMLGISGIFILFSLSIRVSGATNLRPDGEDPDFAPASMVNAEEAKKSGVTVLNPDARITLGFGLMPANIGRDAADSLRLLQLLMAGVVADTLGILIALAFTAGFIPSFLDPSSATVLLSKPLPRWTLLGGKFAGVLSFVGFQAAFFVVGTWLGLGLATGYWNSDYLLCIPFLLLHFGIFFCVSMFIAVWTRSTVASVFGSVLFWFVCFGMNFGRHFVASAGELAPGSPELPAALTWMVDIVYCIFPKPADLNMILHDTLHADSHFAEMEPLQAARSSGRFSPEFSIITSILSGFAFLVLAVRRLSKMDY